MQQQIRASRAMLADQKRKNPGFSMIGLLVTMVCIVVLFALLMNSLNIAVSGGKTQQANTVRSFEDQNNLRSLVATMLAQAETFDTPFITPSRLTRSNDPGQDTTANLFSAMVMQHYAKPSQLISGNEYNLNVREMADYNYELYNPAAGVHWDPNFKADLDTVSNVSFAHMPLCGERYNTYWRYSMNSRFPLLGNRGPKDGVNASMSRAVGRDGIWRGHVAFGDGHVEFIDNPMLGAIGVGGAAGVGQLGAVVGSSLDDVAARADEALAGGNAAPLSARTGGPAGDNIFKMESGPQGADAILSFTRTMTREGPQLQFD